MIRKRITRSREGIAHLLNSAGHVSSVVEYSEKLEVFLEEIEQVVSQEEKKESVFKKMCSFVSLLLPVYRLLMVVLAEAKEFLALVWRN